MKFLIALILCLPTLALAKKYDCTYKTEEKPYSLKISTKSRTAKISLELMNKSVTYSKCKLSKDDFGILIDCSDHRVDLMVILNEDDGSKSGGVMSSTYNLFVDIECR